MSLSATQRDDSMFPEAIWNVEGPRISIVPFAEKHLTPRYVGWLNDPIVTQYSELRHRTHTIESCRAYWNESKRKGNFFGAVCLKSAELHIANISAYRDVENSIIDLAILIGDKECWKQGYGSEAWIVLLNFIVREKLARKVTGGTMATNIRMLRIFKKAGMEKDGQRTRHFIFDGTEIDILYYARFADEGEVKIDDYV